MTGTAREQQPAGPFTAVLMAPPPVAAAGPSSGGQGGIMYDQGPQMQMQGPQGGDYDDVSPYPDGGPQPQYMDGPQPQYIDGPQQPQYIDGPQQPQYVDGPSPNGGDMGLPPNNPGYPTLGDVHDDGVDFAEGSDPQRPLIDGAADSRVVYAGGPDAARAVPMPVLPPLPPHVTPPPPNTEYGQPAPNPMLHPELYANSIDHEEQARQMEGRPSREGPSAGMYGFGRG
ncbi:hypothetical protein AMAG_05725 [Allomyces macrogynus ATCC 38327]|uniref:Uncharacterized protein n=1 Tax=Allomyces macrogynus (strain ATCC 38327) TaxID=578462 RepID=A0A0L0SCQ6_ALLM3|nr:hypothetical protein AMAG_05725 [Allomyces macrogynus ATCC 38327]|eukprot:KNE60328.1 hypothetical protein AMAG_05725 [Allomyces macrogynus ATCC 38327]